MSLVHISLNFKNKSREIPLRRFHQTCIRLSGQWGSGHFQKMLQKDFYPEIGQGRTEKYWRQFPRTHNIQVKFRTGPVQQFHILQQLVLQFFPDIFYHFILVRNRNQGCFPFLCPLLCIGIDMNIFFFPVINTFETFS